MTRTVPIRPLLLLFVLSGAAGLIYEVVWARQLVLVFGNTSQAISAILTGFFGGLAIGGVVGGRLADRATRPLRLYAALELLVVVVVVITPITFRLIGEFYRGAYPGLSESPAGLALVRFALAVLALGPATLLMGATLPTLTRFLTQDGRGFAGAFQRLYAANTIGAIVGTLLAGLVLIEVLGLTGALVVGAACSGTASMTALLLDRRATAMPDEAGSRADGAAIGASPADRAHPAAPDLGPRPTDAARRRRLALSLAFVSGLTSLGYQVVWNRMLAAGTGNSTYVFTIILALFLVGIATGAVLLGFLRPRVRSMTALIGVAQLLTAVFVVIGAAVLAAPASPFNGASANFGSAIRTFALHTAIVVLPPTIAMGLTFPATAALLAEHRGSEGSDTGALLAINTAGSIVATFAIPFVFIPLIGSPAVLAVLAVLNGLVGGWLLFRDRTLQPSGRVVGSVASAMLAVAVIATMATGSAFRNPTIRWIAASGGTVFDATEDEIASVEAGTLGGWSQLWVSGTSMTALTVDTKLMPLLPVMLRPEAKRGLVIAFGMGTAFRSSLVAGIRMDVVELVPSVPEMFHWFYPDADQLLADPDGRVIIADGRNHVELTGETYDFVVVDPPPPIESSGVSVIATLEFYRAAAARLTQDGVMMQWVPYGQTLDEFLAHVRTFLAVFPNVRVVAGPGGNGYFLLGSEGSVEMDPALMRAALERPGVLEDVNGAPDARDRTVDAWVGTLQGLDLAAGDQLRSKVGEGPLITDDRPLPEYFMVRRLLDPDAPRLTPDALQDALR